MKKLLIFFTALFLYTLVNAQSLPEGKKALYYERYDRAATILNTHLQSSPADAEGWYALALAYAGNEQAAEGLNRLKAAPAEVQNEPLFQAALGHLLLMQGKKAEAETHFQHTLSGKGDRNPELLAATARAHVEAKEGSGQRAIELLEQAIRRDKKNPALHTLLGDAYRKLNNGTEAYKAYKDAIDQDPAYAAAYYKVGKIFVTQKNPGAYLPYFNDAIAKDSLYAPALYELYTHYFFTDPAKAMTWFNRYRAHSDADPEQDYAYTDLLYLNKQYDQAITEANRLLQKEDAPARLYKLIAYSYEGQKDTATALTYMNRYFAEEADSNFVQKDFETMGALYASMTDRSDSLNRYEDSAAHYYTRALAMEKDSAAMFPVFKKLATMYKSAKNYAKEAEWLQKYYENNKSANNLDLFNWGLAHYRAEEYGKSDTVFGRYVEAYPEQGFGYYWQARARSMTDPDMQTGAAVPVYKQLIEVLQKGEQTDTDKRWMVEAYSYLAAYETNAQKDYAEAVDYFEKVLEIDPENATAKKYIEVLEKNITASEGSK